MCYFTKKSQSSNWPIFRFLFSSHVISYSFIDLNEDVWSVVTRVRFTPDGSRCLRPHTLSPSTPWSPSRLSGRVADRLSDEMMTLLWEVIPKWKVSGKDCAPSHTRHSISPPRLAASCVDHDWFASDGAQEAPIDFPLFYQKILLYSCITGAWTWLIPPVSKWGIVEKEMILPTP